MENLKGAEALKTYSFRDVTLGFDSALGILTLNAHKSFRENAQTYIEEIDATNPDGAEVIKKLQEARQSPRRFFPPGGSAFSQVELARVYSNWGPKMTYKQAMGKFINDVFPTFFDGRINRNPGTTCVSYLVDMLRIIDPQVATFDDGVATIVETLRDKESRMTPFLLGAMIDDSLKIKSNQDGEVDFLADREGASQLKESLLRRFTPEETKEFERGLTITKEEMLKEMLRIDHGFKFPSN